MIRRETDAAFVNRVVNDDAVRPFLDYRGIDEPMDWTDVVEKCVVLSNGQDAVAAFEELQPRIFQAHLMFLPTCRGERAINTARDMLEWLRPDADIVWGAGPQKNRAVRWFARHLGFAKVQDDVYEAEGPVELFAMRLN